MLSNPIYYTCDLPRTLGSNFHVSIDIEIEYESDAYYVLIFRFGSIFIEIALFPHGAVVLSKGGYSDCKVDGTGVLIPNRCLKLVPTVNIKHIVGKRTSIDSLIHGMQMKKFI